MTWLVNHPAWLASLAVTAGILGREIMALFFVGLDALFFVGLDALFFSLAVFSELLRSF